MRGRRSSDSQMSSSGQRTQTKRLEALAERIWRLIDHRRITIDQLFRQNSVCELKIYRAIAEMLRTGQIAIVDETTHLAKSIMKKGFPIGGIDRVGRRRLLVSHEQWPAAGRLCSLCSALELHRVKMQKKIPLSSKNPIAPNPKRNRRSRQHPTNQSRPD